MYNEKKRKLYQSYIPMGAFLLFAIMPALYEKEWLFSVCGIFSALALIVSVIMSLRSAKSIKDFIRYEEDDAALTNAAWMFIFLIGILVAYGEGSKIVWGWLLFFVADGIMVLSSLFSSKDRKNKEDLANA